MRKILRIALINILVLALLLFAINTASALVLRAYLTYQARPDADPRARLENYEDRQYAEEILREYREVDVEYAPFVEWNRKPFSGKTTTVDSAGDRVEPNAPPPPAGSPIIRFFGGSTMWGTGADDAGTIPAQFRAMDPNWEIHNHGEVGYNTRQDLESLINLLAQGERIDVVVFYGGMNDILSLCRTDASLNGHESQSRMEDRLTGNENPGLAEFVYGLILGETAALVQRIADRGDEQGPGTFACTRDPARAQAVVDTVTRELQLARQLVEAAGARFIAVLQPVAEFGHPRTDHIQKDLKTRKNLGEQTKVVYPLYQKAVASSGAGWWFDLSGAFDGDEHIFIDFVHVSPNGNTIMGRKIHELVRAGTA